MKPQPPKIGWINDVRKQHDMFSFDAQNSLPTPTKKAGGQYQLFVEEDDQILSLIKRIMYAEGDLLTLHQDCAVYLKASLF